MIAQLFAPEGEGGQHWVTKQLGPGTCWQELAWPVLRWGLRGLGQRPHAWGQESLRDFSRLAFSRGSGRVGRGESIHVSLVSLSRFYSKHVKTPGW